MLESVQLEIKDIIAKGNLNCSIDSFLAMTWKTDKARTFFTGEERIAQGNWDFISTYEFLSEDFMRTFKDKLNWSVLFEWQRMSNSFIKENIDKIKTKDDWFSVVFSQNLSEDFIDKYSDTLNWHTIFECQYLNAAFIEKHIDKINKDFMGVDWYNISVRGLLTEEFIEKYPKELDWDNISQYQVLSEEFIEKHKDKVNWKLISEYQPLSEEFIEKHKDDVSWEEINYYQKLSPEMLKKHTILDANLYNEIHKELTKEQKLENMKAYAIRWNLKMEDDSIFAYIRLDMRYKIGIFEHTLYEKGKYYKNWKCDMRDNPVGYTIGFKGNTLVKVNVDDWGVWIKDGNYLFMEEENTPKDCFAKVWGFTVVDYV